MSNIKWKIGWGLSNKCNMACKFCYSRKVRREQKNFDNVIQTGIDFVKKNRNKIDSINFGTGEPTVEPSFFSFCDQLNRVAPNVTLGVTTNGNLAKAARNPYIAGCWVHMRRRFEQAWEVIPKEARKGTISYMAMKQIQAIYREEGKLKELHSKERLEQQQAIIKPLVDAFFVYLKQNQTEVYGSGKLHDAFTYALNQEKYLKVFLEDGEVPIDNNASERAIRGFCVGKKNWHMIDTINGAKTSAMIYSIAETAKANNLKPYDYFEHLLEEIPKHMEDTDRSFLKELLPWSDKLPKHIRK